MTSNELRKRYERESRNLVPKDWICMGSVVERTYTRIVGERKKRFGPYYSWTRKLNNKTVTTALTRQQFDLLRQAIRCHQSLNKTLAALRDISIRYILSTTPCVSKRKRR
jgi:hypothetical protein